MRTNFLTSVCMCVWNGEFSRTEMVLDGGDSRVSEARTFAILNGVSLAEPPLERNIGQGAAQNTAYNLVIALPSVRCSRARTRVRNFIGATCHVCLCAVLSLTSGV